MMKRLDPIDGMRLSGGCCSLRCMIIEVSFFLLEIRDDTDMPKGGRRREFTFGDTSSLWSIQCFCTIRAYLTQHVTLLIKGKNVVSRGTFDRATASHMDHSSLLGLDHK